MRPVVSREKADRYRHRACVVRHWCEWKEACCLWKAVETGQNRHGAHVFAFLPFDLLLLERLWVLVLWCALLQLRSACVEVGRRE